MSRRDDRAARAEARVGLELGARFRLERLLGVGGSAAVYAARHRNGHRVALKVLHGELTASELQRKRFLREAYVANTIGHEGVARIYDDGVDASGALYLVMELLEGETLEERARRAPLDATFLLDVADQLLDVLAAAHARGIVHRDIKPANLFLTRAQRLRVLDFGIARVREASAQGRADTHAGIALGTPAFMPQEQARGRWDEIGAHSDLWSAGATLFALASGRLVHEGETPNEQLGRAMTMSPRALATLVPEIDPAFAAIVDRALRFEPSERWPDARSMQAALRALPASPYCGQPLPRVALPAPADVRAQASLTITASATPPEITAPRRSARKLAAVLLLASVLPVLSPHVAGSVRAHAPSNAVHASARAPRVPPVEASAARAVGSVASPSAPAVTSALRATPEPPPRPSARAPRRLVLERASHVVERAPASVDLLDRRY